MAIIKTEDLYHDYAQFSPDGEQNSVIHALSGISLEVKKGQFIVIAGRNGCGKSTLAKHINALLLPSEGAVWVKHMDTRDELKTGSIRKSAGMVFQDPDNQIVAQIVEEDVAFGPENIGVKTDDIWKRVEYALSVTKMSAYRYTSTNRLSGGQKQRLAIAGVMAMKPECIILDEPTAMLDPEGRKEVISALSRLNKAEGVTIVLITHNMEEAVSADVVFVMHAGRIALNGSPRQVFKKAELLKKLGLELPQVTLLAHELHQAGLNIHEPALGISELVNQICLFN